MPRTNHSTGTPWEPLVGYQGVKKGDRVGDQFVEVRVEVPDELSEEEKKAMEEFAEASGMRH